jgi:hypothetical protein
VAETLTAAHAGWRWVAVGLLLVATAIGMLGWNGRRAWSAGGSRVMLAAMIAFDVQVALGVATYAALRVWESGDSFRAMIHPFTMALALVVVHVTRARTRSTTEDRGRHRWLALGCLIALIIAASGGALAQ